MTPVCFQDCLLLIPTAMERDGILSFPLLERFINQSRVDVELCGFGPIAAAAKTARFLAQKRYRKVILTGIAGTYCASLAVGTACLFEQVACWGVGAGSGKDFRLAPEIGFSQLVEEFPSAPTRDVLNLHCPVSLNPRRLLLTCCSAAGSEIDCLQRLEHFTEAVAEDMEGFGVAMACYEAQVPLTIVRGISNRAGNRRVSEWAMKPAFASAAELVTGVLKTFQGEVG